MKNRQPQLENWEVALIRAMLDSGAYTKQQIVAYFSRPDRSVNQGRISEIENNHERYAGIDAAPPEALVTFLEDWNKIRFPAAPALPPGPTHPDTLAARFKRRDGNPARLNVAETSSVEGKQKLDWGSRHKYCKTLAGMANKDGGYILFGVKDGSFEVVGIRPDRMEKFDLKKANEFITRSFNQALDIEKGQFEIDGKTVGVLYVHPSKSKPVICTAEGSDLYSGDIYFRYPGETRRIQAPELFNLLQERDSRAGERVLQLVGTLAETGVHNAAVINLATGEVEGEKGGFLIEESLLDKIKFVAEGKFVEKDGTPALRVVGDVQPVGGPKVTIEQSVVGSITELHIHEAFLYQKCQYQPVAYIQAQTHMQPLWLPIFFFAAEANLDLPALIETLKKSGSPYAQRISKQIDRVKSGRPPTGVPTSANVKSELDALLSNEPITVDDAIAARRFLQALRHLSPDQIELARVLSVLIDLRARFGNIQDLRSDFRYSIATVDLNWFRQLVVTATK